LNDERRNDAGKNRGPCPSHGRGTFASRSHDFASEMTTQRQRGRTKDVPAPACSKAVVQGSSRITAIS
jgi:hypothetical protein